MRPSDVDSTNTDDTSAESSVRASSALRRFDLSLREQALAAILCLLVTGWLFMLPKPGAPDETPMLWKSRPACCSEPLAELRMEALDRAVPTFESGRNLFAFASRQEVQRSKTSDPYQRKIRYQGVDTLDDTPPEEPPLELPILGVFGPERLRIAVLEGGSGGPTNLLEQDVVQGRYRVLEIRSKSILLRDTESPGSPPILVEMP